MKIHLKAYDDFFRPLIDVTWVGDTKPKLSILKRFLKKHLAGQFNYHLELVNKSGAKNTTYTDQDYIDQDNITLHLQAKYNQIHDIYLQGNVKITVDSIQNQNPEKFKKYSRFINQDATSARVFPVPDDIQKFLVAQTPIEQRDLLTHAYKEAIHSLAIDFDLRGSFETSGSACTTLIAISLPLIDKPGNKTEKRVEAIIGQIGDTSVILVSDDKMQFLTTPHKVTDAKETARIKESINGYVKNGYVRTRTKRHGGLAMTRALGDGGLRSAGVVSEADITFRSLLPNDIFMLCSDGYTDYIRFSDISTLAHDAKKEVEEMTKHCIYDDITRLKIENLAKLTFGTIFFGTVCDGHGPSGHLVAIETVRTLPAIFFKKLAALCLKKQSKEVNSNFFSTQTTPSVADQKTPEHKPSVKFPHIQQPKR